jgi:hypothetical protein
MARLWGEEGEPLGVEIKPLFFRWLSAFLKLVKKGFPGFA